MSTNPTYAQLFRFLAELGFVDVSIKGPDRALHHPASDTLLVFSSLRGPDDAVVNADFLSAERFLREKQLIARPLRTLLVPSQTLSELPDNDTS